MVIKINYTSSDVYVSTSVSPVYVVVNYSGTTGGGGGVWGAITGTLSNQTDLQTALDNKVPYTGATTNVNLGEFALSAGQLTLDTTPTGTASVGTTRWNDTIGSSETTLKGGSVILKNGVDLVARVVNKVSPNTTLTKAAYQAVKVSGAQGQRLAISLAQANNDANSADTIGLVTETIATNQEGFIMTVGNLEGINTTGSLQGETWADGDVLYLSPTTAGRLTNIKPNGSTGHIVVIGYVEYAHANNGKIYVKIMNGWELSELHDTFIDTPLNDQVLTYESSTQLWKNKAVSSANIYTANGTLTADRTVTSGGNSLTILGGKEINTNIETALVLQGSATNKFIELRLQNTSAIGRTYGLRSDTDGKLTFLNYTLLGNIYQYDPTNTQHTFNGSQVNLIGSSITNVGLWLNTTSGTLSNYTLYNNAGITLINATADMRFSISNSEKFRLTNAGRLLLGTTTEGTFLLDVNGTARVSGTLTTANITSSSDLAHDIGSFSVRYSTAYVRGIGSGNAVFSIFNNSGTSITIASTNNVLLGTTTDVASSILTLASTTKGFLPPRMTTAQRDAITSPATGLQIYNTSTNANNYYDGTAWVAAGGGGTTIYSGDGTLAGNRSVTHGGFNLSFIGGTFTNRFTAAGRLLLGMTTESTHILDINGTLRVVNAVIKSDSLNNFSIGTGNASTPSGGNTNFLGFGAGENAGSASNSNFLGQYAGFNAITATHSNFFGVSCGNGASGVTQSNFMSQLAGYNATNASHSNFFGNNAGNAASAANNSNFIGQQAGQFATNANNSNFIGSGAGYSATNASYSNFFGREAGVVGTNASFSNFFGLNAGYNATSASHSNFFGRNCGLNASGASYSTFLGYNIGNATTHTITGTNNILIGLNITTPTAASANMFSIGNVLYGFNTYATTSGNPATAAQTTGKIGVNTNSPHASAILDLTSTTNGFLPPRMTTTQKNAITSPAAGLQVYDTTLNQMSYYNGTTWVNF